VRHKHPTLAQLCKPAPERAADKEKPAAAWEIADKPAVLRRACLVAPRMCHAKPSPGCRATPCHAKHLRRALAPYTRGRREAPLADRTPRMRTAKAALIAELAFAQA